MEPRDRAAQAVSDGSAIWRFRTAACCMVLVAIAMTQSPGRIVSDTKLDLAIDPGGFLQRATHLWDPNGAFGQVQNQAYGYFLPMGPFFWIGDLLRFEPWVVQRLWWALLLAVAFVGFIRLARLLDIGSPAMRLVGGFAFALSPRILSGIGSSSIEIWPMALAPWVLVPLVVGSTRRSAVAMSALSAVAVAAVGGVNAAATFAVVPLAGLWLLLAPRGRRRRLMLLTWPVFVLLGTAWWLVPLLLLGRYSPPFLDFIESASITSFSSTLLDAARGTSNWTAYISDTNVAGRDLVSNQILLLNLAVVLALSVAGLCGRGLPHRGFLLAGAATGLVLVTLGHTASHGGLLAEQVQDLLDGPLAPLRNTHKFDVVVRLPLVLGFTHLLSRAAGAASTVVGRSRRWGPGAGVVVLAVTALLGSTTPAWSGQLAPRSSFDDVPDYWRQAATWLDENAQRQRALVLPASSFGTYLWGTTNDEPLQPLADTRWGVRNAIPLAPPGNIRMLDAVERELNEGRGSDALAAYLRSGGVGVLVVRNDVKASSDGMDPEVLHESLAATGARLVASYGPVTGGAPRIEAADGSQTFIDQGWQSEHAAIEIYRIGAAPRVRALPWRSVPVLVGAAPSQIGLLDAGLLTSPSVVMASDWPDDDTPLNYLLTDGSRRQEVAFGRVHDNRSASLGRSDAFSAERRVHDYAESDDDRWLSVPELEGATRIMASSSQGSAGTASRIDPSAQPWSAFDRDPTTAWTASPSDASRSWIRIEFDEPTDVTNTRVVVDGDPLESIQLTVRSDSGSVVQTVRKGVSQAISGLGGDARVLEVSGRSTGDHPLSIRDITVPGVDLSRPLRLPEIPGDWEAPRAIMFEASEGYSSGCLDVDGYLRCASGEDRWGEDGRHLDRVFSLPAGDTYPLSLEVEPVGGQALDALLQQGRLVKIESSSQVVRSAQASVLAAVDDDVETTWLAATGEIRPTLEVSWVGERPISTVRAFREELAAASRPTKAVLRFSDGSRRSVTFRADGVARFPAVTADAVSIEFTETSRSPSLGSDGTGRVLPLGVSELRVGSGDLLPISLADSIDLPCGSGPDVEVDGQVRETRIVASTASVRAGDRLRARVCGNDEVSLSAGEHRITVTGTRAFRPTRLSLGSEADDVEPTQVGVSSWTGQGRAVRIGGDGARLLTVTENTNAGWTASSGSPVVVNGWQQGWKVDDDDVVLTFEPDRTYRGGLVVGGVLLVILLALAGVLASRLRGADPPPRPSRPGWVSLAMGTAATGVTALVVGGFLGLGAVAAGLGVGLVVVRYSALDLGLVAGGLVAVVAGASAIRPWGGAEAWLGTMTWPQVVMVCVSGVVAASLLGRPRSRSRENGISTTE